MKFINKNAYIQTAIFSTSFCTSCRESFGLIFRNAARVSAVSYVSAAVLIIGKIFISAVVTVFSYYAIVNNLSTELHSIAGPVAVIFLISYWIGDMFMDVLDMGILTVLHCFIADEEMFDGEERYHDRDLKDYVDRAGGANAGDRSLKSSNIPSDQDVKRSNMDDGDIVDENPTGGENTTKSEN